jgi:insecticidal toxin complex protein TccC
VDAVTSVNSLSGAALLAQSVDAGWRLSLQDETGQARQHWDGMGNTSCFEFDGMGRPLSIEQSTAHGPALCIERFYYGSCGPEFSQRNHCGQLIRHADTAGVRAVAHFGLQGAPLEESRRFLTEFEHVGWPANEDEQDALLEPDADKTYTTRWQYSALGESLLQIDAAGHARRYRHDLAGQLKAAWLVVADKDERLLVSDQTYNASGKIEHEKAGNGVISMWAYDPADGRMRQLSARKGGRSLQDLRYDYDPVGNVISMDDQSQLVTWFANQRVDPVNRYSYDSLYQLVRATGREVASAGNGPGLISPVDPSRLQNYLQTWRYDAGGNMTEQRHSGRPSQFMDIAPDSNRSLLRVDGHEPDFKSSFDSNGNLKQLVPGQTLHWTVRNQLAEVVLVHRPDAASDSERYIYDGAGQRVRKVRFSQAASVTRKGQVRYLPGLEIRTEGTTDVEDEVLHVITVPVGRSPVRMLHWELGRPSEISEDQLRYSLDDRLGSSTLELDEEGRLISYEGYYAYGGTAWWMARSQIEVQYKFVRYSGKECDVTGLYYYGFRYYAPWLLRWISPDPAGVVDGLNLFCMVKSNPISLHDMDGLYSGKGDVKEEVIKKHSKIVARGRSEMSQRSREYIGKAIDLAHDVLSHAVQVLSTSGANDQSYKDVESVYGEDAAKKRGGDLLSRLEALRDAVANYKEGGSRSDQLALTDAKSGKENSFASVVTNDSHKRIFFSRSSYKQRNNLFNIVHTIVHEVSHLELNTHDFYDYEVHGGDDEKLQVKFNRLSDELNDLAKGVMDLLISEAISEANDSGATDSDELREVFGTGDVKRIKSKIEGWSKRYRENAIWHNADSIAVVAMLIGRPALAKHLS